MFVGWNWMNFMLISVVLVCSVNVCLFLVYFQELDVILNDLLILLVVSIIVGVLNMMNWLFFCQQLKVLVIVFWFLSSLVMVYLVNILICVLQLLSLVWFFCCSEIIFCCRVWINFRLVWLLMCVSCGQVCLLKLC